MTPSIKQLTNVMENRKCIAYYNYMSKRLTVVTYPEKERLIDIYKKDVPEFDTYVDVADEHSFMFGSIPEDPIPERFITTPYKW